jgi:hypothetical protein
LTTVGAIFGFFLCKTGYTVRLVILVGKNTLSCKLARTHGAHQAVFMVDIIFECHDRFQNRLHTFETLGCAFYLVFTIASAANWTSAFRLKDTLLGEFFVALRARKTFHMKLLLIVNSYCSR